MMDPDDLIHFGSRTDETPGQFDARVALLRRITPVLTDLARQGFTIVVESERASMKVRALRSDFVVEFGDLRLRVILMPGETQPLAREDFIADLRHNFLEFPDTDAVALVADDLDCSAWVVDVYDVNRDAHLRTLQGRPLGAALGDYFVKNLFAVEIPDFRQVVVLPTVEKLQQLLDAKVRTCFARAQAQRARIPEKVAALESLSSADLARILGALRDALKLTSVTPSQLLGDEGSEP